MIRVTLDTSAGLAWLLNEERPGWVDRLMAEARSGAAALAVSTLFWLEVGNRLARESTMTHDQAIDGMLRLESLGIETTELDRPMRLHALQLARAERLSMYDASHLALADALQSPLATLDRRLDAAAARHGLSYAEPGHRLAEDSTPYELETDHASLASIGAGLAELRKRYATT
jgi:predicted nucleic acid-binding protein